MTVYIFLPHTLLRLKRLTMLAYDDFFRDR